MNVLKIYFLVLSFLAIPQALAIDYETCDWRNELSSPFLHPNQGTRRFANLLSNGRNTRFKVNNACIMASTQKITSSGSKEKFVYCEKRKNKWIKTNIKVTRCEEELNGETCEERFLYPRRPCLNENYITKTNQIFHNMAKCFNLSVPELFVLFNHESGFVSNVRSFTGARCYGQMTVDGIKAVNYYIKKQHPIYTNFLAKCPQYGKNLTISTPRSKRDLYQTDCELTKSPFSCLFYSTFHVKSLMVKIKNMLEGTDRIHKSYRWIESDLNIELPIRINEIVIATDSSQGRDRFYIFKDEKELHQNRNGRLVKKFNELKKSSEVRFTKVPIFSNKAKDQLNWILTYWSYNGGDTVGIKHFKEYMSQLKNNISLSCKKSSQFYCHKRTALLNNFGNEIYGLDIENHLIDDFSEYLKVNYENERNRLEVSGFIHNLIKSLDPIFKTRACNLNDSIVKN
ncbi:MAG: hypothetical protein ACR2M7_03770 [Bdellovibrionales bacterium]